MQTKIILLTIFFSVLIETASDAKTFYVSKTGDDTHSGTETAPFLTINKAAQLAEAGDTVLVGDGIYRETVKPRNGGTDESHRITYTVKKRGTVIVKGSEEINDWRLFRNNVWCAVLPNTFFGSYNPFATRHPRQNQGDYFDVYTCGDVYLNDEAFCQKGTLDELQDTEKTWYAEVDDESTTIYAHFGGVNPNEALTEINVRQQVFAPDVWGLGYITLDGFTIMHAANWYSDYPDTPQRRQAGAISVNGGLKWIIENNTIINARSIGIDIGLGIVNWNRSLKTNFNETEKYGSHIVRNNNIAKCGQSGIVGVMSWKSQILNNRIEDTNYRNEFCGDETAAIKVHFCNYGLIKGNDIKTSKGKNAAGIWTDWGNQGLRVTGNVIVDCPWGYYGEAAHGSILVDNNVFIGNQCIRMSDSTGIVFAHNLIADKENVKVDGEGRNCSYFEPQTMKLHSAVSFPQNCYWFNNLLTSSTIPENSTNRTHIQEGNSVITNFRYTATAREVRVSFDYHSDGESKLTLVTQKRIGLIPNTNESISGDVDTDLFGDLIQKEKVKTGPFQNIKNGANTFHIVRLP